MKPAFKNILAAAAKAAWERRRCLQFWNVTPKNESPHLFHVSLPGVFYPLLRHILPFCLPKKNNALLLCRQRFISALFEGITTYKSFSSIGSKELRLCIFRVLNFKMSHNQHAASSSYVVGVRTIFMKYLTLCFDLSRIFRVAKKYHIFGRVCKSKLLDHHRKAEKVAF